MREEEVDHGLQMNMEVGGRVTQKERNGQGPQVCWGGELRICHQDKRVCV